MNVYDFIDIFRYFITHYFSIINVKKAEIYKKKLIKLHLSAFFYYHSTSTDKKTGMSFVIFI